MSRGGKRPGAGRPKGRPEEKFVVKAFSLTPGTVARLESAAEQGRAMSHLVEAALRAYLK
jgi:hypothetical protein